MGTLLSYYYPGTQTDQKEQWIDSAILFPGFVLSLSRGACRILYNISTTSGSFYWLSIFMALLQVKPFLLPLKTAIFTAIVTEMVDLHV